MLDRIVTAIETQGWFSAPGIVPAIELKRINQFFEKKRELFLPAQVGSGVKRVRQESIRGDSIYWLDPLSPPAEFLVISRLLRDLQQELNRRCFLGIKDLEHHLAFYPPGTQYQKHLDHFVGDTTRVLSFVFYLNESWDPQDGGELILYDHQCEQLGSVTPSPGTLACFLSADFPHEVRPAARERRSLTGWMRTKIIN